jgi:AcrR family transcriptional regulator
MPHRIRPPLQARSVASTNRMLDAAEALFAAGGAEAITVEAVVRSARTSVGSFYARFVDRAGLFAAMHGRFLERLQAEAGAAVAAAMSESTLPRVVAAFVKQSLPAAVRHRESILFFVVASATDTPLRQQGLAANPGFAAAFASVVMPFRTEILHARPELAVDVAFRMFFAAFIQRALFTPKEATGRAVSDAALATEISSCLIAYLSSPRGVARARVSGAHTQR